MDHNAAPQPSTETNFSLLTPAELLERGTALRAELSGIYTTFVAEHHLAGESGEAAVITAWNSGQQPRAVCGDAYRGGHDLLVVHGKTVPEDFFATLREDPDAEGRSGLGNGTVGIVYDEADMAGYCHPPYGDSVDSPVSVEPVVFPGSADDPRFNPTEVAEGLQHLSEAMADYRTQQAQA